MTIRELILRLREFPSDAEVYVASSTSANGWTPGMIRGEIMQGNDHIEQVTIHGTGPAKGK